MREVIIRHKSDKPEGHEIVETVCELIRCGDCKYVINDTYEGHDVCICNINTWRRCEGIKPSDYYCGWAERGQPCGGKK